MIWPPSFPHCAMFSSSRGIISTIFCSTPHLACNRIIPYLGGSIREKYGGIIFSFYCHFINCQPRFCGYYVDFEYKGWDFRKSTARWVSWATITCRHTRHGEVALSADNDECCMFNNHQNHFPVPLVCLLWLIALINSVNSGILLPQLTATCLVFKTYRFRISSLNLFN